MNDFQEPKKVIEGAQNIYIFPSGKENPESVPCSLALFYTLKEQKKNVNLIIDDFPEKFRFLIPSLDFLSYPKDFIISIPTTKAKFSQIRYDKTEENLKICLALDKGEIKKNEISFYFSEPKPDLLITIGSNPSPSAEGEGSKDLDFLKKNNLFSFGAKPPVLNINNQETTDPAPEQARYGAGNENIIKTNLTPHQSKLGTWQVKNNSSLAELFTDFIKSIDENLIKENVATALLTGLIIFSDNFQNPNTSAEILETAAFLIKKRAKHQQIIDGLYKI